MWCEAVGANCDISFTDAGHEPTEGYASRFLKYLFTELGDEDFKDKNDDWKNESILRKFDQ